MTTTLAPTTTGSYTLDPTHSRIGFVARHAMVTKVRGSFNEFEGSGRFDADNLAESSLEVTIKAASIDTGNADRDAHVRNEDFLAVDAFPEITFVATGIKAEGDDEFKITGDLTIKDVTKPVTFDVEYAGAAKDPFGNDRIGLEGSTSISRKEWGLTWNAALETGGVLVGDKVTLEFDASAIKAD